ncbi:MAG: PEGA domain-containing protein, partial [Deltaproteobacteria bacterium]|nr:PEGA domain-containing protein [Deltaproteobacteria bacterium]
MRKLRALVALLAMLAVPAVARAQVSIAVLGFESIEVPEDVANQVTLALRVRATHAKLRVVPGKPLVEMKLVFGCLDEAPACMSQIGSSLGAEKLLYGAVRKSRTGYSVTLKFLDVGKARLENEQTFQLVKGDAREAPLRGHAEKWFVAVTGLKATGTLRITPSVAGAKVSVDDVVIGTSTGLEPVVAGDLRPGKHEVVVVAKKHKRFTASVRVAPGETLEVNAQLEKEEEVVGPTGPTGVVAPTGIVAPTGTAP